MNSYEGQVDLNCRLSDSVYGMPVYLYRGASVCVAIRLGHVTISLDTIRFGQSVCVCDKHGSRCHGVMVFW